MNVNSSNSAQNISNISLSESTVLEDAAVVTAWAILGIYGLVTNILIVLAILRNQKLRKSTSYWLMLSLCLCDCSMIVVCLCHLLPATALKHRFLDYKSWWNAFGLFIYDSFWYSGVLHLIIMSTNRYVNICHNKAYSLLFSGTKSVWIILSAYFLGTVIAFPGLFPCCHVVYNYAAYSAAYDPVDTNYMYVDLAVNGLSMLVMIVCYGLIMLEVRKSRVLMQSYKRMCKSAAQSDAYKRRSSKIVRLIRNPENPNVPVVSKREIRLFVQFAVVSFVFFASFTTWQWLPRVFWSKWTGFVCTSLFFINNATNPTIYLIFNISLRKELQRLLCAEKEVSDGQSSKSNDPNKKKDANGGLRNRNRDTGSEPTVCFIQPSNYLSAPDPVNRTQSGSSRTHFLTFENSSFDGGPSAVGIPFIEEASSGVPSPMLQRISKDSYLGPVFKGSPGSPRVLNGSPGFGSPRVHIGVVYNASPKSAKRYFGARPGCGSSSRTNYRPVNVVDKNYSSRGLLRSPVGLPETEVSLMLDTSLIFANTSEVDQLSLDEISPGFDTV